MSGTRRLGADVEHVGARRPLLERVRDRVLAVRFPVAGKRVGRRVDDAHEIRALAPDEANIANLKRANSANARDHEGRARHDDDVRSVGVAPRDTQGLDRIGDRPRRDPFLLRDVEQPLRTRRRPARRFERSKDEGSGQLEERAQYADRVLHLRKRYDEREAPIGKRFGESLGEILGFVGIVRDVENDAWERRKEFHASGDDQPRKGAFHVFDAGSGLGP